MSAVTELQSTNAADERVQSEQSKFVQHLATYPALTALAGLVASFPVAKIFASNAVPLLHAIHERSKPVAEPLVETAAPYLRTLDKVGDSALNKVDQRFPQLKTVHPSEIYEGAQNYVGSVKGNAKNAYDNRVGKPLSNAALAARNQYDSIYDTQVGSYVGPFNKKLESVIDQYLPDDKNDTAPSDFESNSQVKRTYSLARLAAERAAPKLKKVYSQKLDEQTDGRPDPGYLSKLLAALATGKFLSIESYNLILNYFGTPEKLEKAVDEVKAIAAGYREEAENVASAELNELKA